MLSRSRRDKCIIQERTDTALRVNVATAVPTWMPTGSPSVEKMLESGVPSGATLPVFYLSPFTQSIRTASNASK